MIVDHLADVQMPLDRCTDDTSKHKSLKMAVHQGQGPGPGLSIKLLVKS